MVSKFNMNLDIFKDIMINNQPVIRLQVGDIIIWQKQSGTWKLDEDGCIIGSDGKYYQRLYDDSHLIDNNPIVDLNSEWVIDTVSGSLNINKDFDYFMSNSNWHVSNGYAQFKITWNNLEEVNFLYRSYAESSYDYLVINGVDKPKFTTKPSYNTSGVLAHTMGSQTTTYKTLNVKTPDKGEHFIWFCYIKDGSVDSNSDRAFVGVPNNYKSGEIIEKQGSELRYEFIQSEDYVIAREGYIQYKKYKTYFSPNNAHSWTIKDIYELGPEVPATPITRNYLRFDAKYGDLTVGFYKPTIFKNLEYSLGYEETWQPFNENVLVKNNTSIYFRAKGADGSTTQKYFTTDILCECHGNIMSLLSANFENNTTITNNYSFAHLFKNCKITTAPELPATTLSGSNCYGYMFSGCTSLETAPALPATTIIKSCYEYMFEGCTSLVNAPALPATTLKANCYVKMFSDCTSLVNAPALPGTALDSSCYQAMFSGCTKLATAPALPATVLKSSCYAYMFQNCTSLVNAPALPGTTLGSSCYQYMFSGCAKLVTAPALPATATTGSCYQYMFQNCTSLVNAPALPATTITSKCYKYMFYRCTSLETAPDLPATILADNCYEYMFSGCTKITTAPDLPATTLGSSCYSYMFNGCTSLVNAPDLPATTLKSGCYNYMFGGCTKLATAPDLPATTLVSNSCYYGMFSNCTSLTVSPKIYATTITGTSWDVGAMFSNCKNLRKVYCNIMYVNSTVITSSIGDSWLLLVPNESSCIFYKNPNWSGPTTRNTNTIPSNWQIVDWIQDAA